MVFGLDADNVTLGTPPAIATALDLGSNGYSPTQSDAARRPTQVSDGGGNNFRFTSASTNQLNFTGFGTGIGAAVSTQFSLFFKLKLVTTPNYGAIYDQHATGANLKMFIGTRANNTDNFAVFLSGDGTATNESRFPHADWTAWHSIAISYNGAGVGNAGRLQLYTDTISQTLSQASGSVPASTFASTDTPVFGGEGAAGGGISLNGLVAYLWMINRAATASDVAFMHAWDPRA